MACKPYSEDINLTVKLHPHAVQKSSDQRRAWEFLKAFSNIHVVGLAEGKELSTDDLIQQSSEFRFSFIVGAEIIASGKKHSHLALPYDYLTVLQLAHMMNCGLLLRVISKFFMS